MKGGRITLTLDRSITSVLYVTLSQSVNLLFVSSFPQIQVPLVWLVFSVLTILPKSKDLLRF